MTGPGRLAGAVLVGGASSRFGRDKAWITLDGSALAVRVARVLGEAGAAPVVAVGGSRHEARSRDLAWVADRWPGAGPLGGIVTAIDHISRVAPDVESVAVLGCDLARPAPDAVLGLADALASRRSAQVAVASSDDARQWHLAVWRVSSLEPLVACFDRGERSIWRAAQVLEVVDVDDLPPSSLLDIDTPEELPASSDLPPRNPLRR